MSSFNRTYADMVAQAESKGQKVVLPRPSELFVDIDDEASLARFHSAYKILLEAFPKATYEISPSPSLAEHHFHITVDLGSGVVLAQMTSVALAAALGDDPKRAVLNVRRVLEGNTDPVAFYERET